MILPQAIAAWIGDRPLLPVSGGQSGAAVFRIDDARDALFLKVGRGECAELVAHEAARLRWLAGRMPCPDVRASVEEESAAWLVTSALPGRTAGAFLKSDRARIPSVVEALADFLRRLHALPVDDCPFDSSLGAWMPVVRDLVSAGRVDTGDLDAEHRGWSARRVLAKVDDLAGHEQGRVIVHGDFSLGNVVVDDDGQVIGCIDVGRLGVGDPYRDIFIGWRDLGSFGAEAQAAFLSGLGIAALDDDRRELHRALDELF